MTQSQEQKEFFAEFGNKVHDSVESVELASIQADKETYNALGLSVPAGKIELWGLIIFCAGGLYFYVAPSENYMTVLMRQAAHEKAPAEQMADLLALDRLSASLPQRRWYSFLFPETKCRIDMAFSDKSGITHFFTFATHRDAFEIYRKVLSKIPAGNHS